MWRAPDRRGFTLLEVMVALALAGMVLVAALGVAAADLRASRRAAAVQEAATLADAVLERAALATRDELVAWERGAEGRWQPPLDGYAWRVRAAPMAGEASLFAVQVEVSWAGGSFVAHTRVARPLPPPVAVSP